MRVLIGCAAVWLMVAVPARASAATIGYFFFDASVDSPFSIELFDSAISPTDYLTNLQLTLFQNGSVDETGKFTGDPSSSVMNFLQCPSGATCATDALVPMQAFAGASTLSCSDSPACVTGFGDFSFDSATLTATFSQPGYDVSIDPLLGLIPDDLSSFAFAAIDVTQTPVPEPSTLLLLASGAAFAFRRRRSYTAERR